MPPDELRTTLPGDDHVRVRSESERIIDARIVPWGVRADTTEGPEVWVRGAFRGVDPGSVGLEAIGPHGREPGVRLCGRAESIEERVDGAYASFRVSRTAAGDEMLALVSDGVYRDVSVVFEPIESRSNGGVTERRRANLRRVGIVERGAYHGEASVLAVRSMGDPPMPPETPPDPTPTPEPPPTPTPEPPPTLGLVVRSGDLDALRGDMLGRMAALEARGSARSASPFAVYPTFADYLVASFDDGAAAALLARAFADQITTDNPGVMQPSYLGEVFGIIAQSRPAITAFGGARGLGASGMSLHWPFFDGDLSVLVAKQATEKTDIASVKVSIKDGSTPVATYAGGSDVSYQLIRRSSPSYLEAYGRIMLAAWSLVVDNAFTAAILAAATGSIVYDPTAADVNGADAQAAFFAASAKVKGATGTPATFALASSDSFAALGANPALKPSAYGTQNLPGTAQASTLAVSVSGLAVIEATALPAQTMLFSNPSAGGWHEDGPFIATAEDVLKLGQNRAVWSMGAPAAYLPAGIVKTTLVARSRA